MIVNYIHLIVMEMIILNCMKLGNIVKVIL